MERRWRLEINIIVPSVRSSTPCREADLLCRVLRVGLGREFSGLHVAGVQFRIMLPFLWQILECKDRRYRADGNASTAIDALDRIDVELRNLIEAGAAILIAGVLLGVDAIYG